MRRIFTLIVLLFTMPCLINSFSDLDWKSLLNHFDIIINHSSNTTQSIKGYNRNNAIVVQGSPLRPPTPTMIKPPRFGIVPPTPSIPRALPVEVHVAQNQNNAAVVQIPTLKNEPPYHPLPSYETNSIFKSIDSMLRDQFPVELGNSNAKVLSAERQILPMKTKFRITYSTNQGISSWVTVLEIPSQVTPFSGVHTLKFNSNNEQNIENQQFEQFERFRTDNAFKVMDNTVRSLYKQLENTQVTSVQLKHFLNGIMYWRLNYKGFDRQYRVILYSNSLTNVKRVVTFRAIQPKKS